jgi:VWFA-related protein
MKHHQWIRTIPLAILFLGLVLCIGAAAGGQGTPQSARPSSAMSSAPQSAPEAPLPNQNIIRVEVPIVTVDVVVTDKKGKAVKGLTSHDFKLYEDGVLQEIANFDYVSEDDPTTQFASIISDRPLMPERQNYVLFLFDNTTMNPASQEMARKAAAKFVDESLRPGDLVAIAHYRNSMEIVQNFTDNKSRLARAFGVIKTTEAPESGQSATQTGTNPTLDRAQQSLRSLGAAFGARNLMIAMRGLFNSMRNVKGRKSLIVFSGGLTLAADDSLDLFSAIDAANKANVTVYTIDAKGLTVDLPTTSPAPRRISFNSPLSFPGLGTFVNSFQGSPRGGGEGSRGGSGGGGTGGSTGGGRTGGDWSGGRGNTGGTGGTRGGNPGNPGRTGNPNNPNNPNASNNNPNNPLNNPDLANQRLDQLSLNELKDVLQIMATETGGFYIRNTNDFDKGLMDIKSEMRNYYSLGYESNSKVHDGKFRAIKVEMQKKGYVAKYRKGYFDQRPLDALAGTPAEKPLTKAIDDPNPITALPLRLVCDYFYEGPGQARAPLTVQLPVSKMKFKKDKNIRTDSIDVLGVAFRQDGTPAARFSDTVIFKLDNDSFKKVSENATFRIPNYFNLQPGKYRIKVAVHDEGDILGTVEQSLEIPAYKPGEFSASSLVMTNDVRPISSLMNNLESQLIDEKNPLIFNGVKVYQSVDRKFYQNQAVALYFTLYNLSVDPKQDKPNLLVTYAILTEDKVAFQSPLFRISDPPRMENGVLPMGFSIVLKDLSPRQYTIQLMVRDGVTNATRYLRSQFQVQAPTQQ